MCVEVLCLIDHVWSSKECACDPSVHLSVPSIWCMFVFMSVVGLCGGLWECLLCSGHC